MKKRFLILILCLFLPLGFVACESVNKKLLSTPNNLVVEADGIITFERVDNDEYYVINVNGLEQSVFVANKNKYTELYNSNGVNYLQYDISRLLNLGESYSIKVKACANNKKDSTYTAPVSYVHQVRIDTPETKIIGNTLTWDNVYNANSYMVKVVTPSTIVPADDPETIANANVFSSVYSLNKFNFASMLTEAGEYKFYVKAMSREANYLESGFSAKVVYENYVNLVAPTNLRLHKIDNEWLLTCVVDNYANALKVQFNNFEEIVDINETSIELDENVPNLIKINLNTLFAGKGIDFANLTYAKISLASIFQTQGKNFYTNSAMSEPAELTSKNRLTAPTIEYNTQTNTVSWQGEDNFNIAGYKVYVCTASEVKTHILSSETGTMSIEMPDDFVSVAVLALGKGDYENSCLSEFKHNSANVQIPLSISLNENKIVWTEIENAYYIVETNNGVEVMTEHEIDLSNLNYVLTEIEVTAVSTGKNSNTAKSNPNYSVKLATPKNAGFVSSNKYLLSFDHVTGAIGYKIWITDLSQSTNQAICISQLFTTNRVDLSSFVTRGREYRVQVQAVADKYGNHLDSDLSSPTLTLAYNHMLDMPEYVYATATSPISVEGEGTNKKYYVNFNGVEGADRYEIMVNFNSRTIKDDNRTNPYSVDITDFLTNVDGEVMANAYNITVRALPNDNDTVTQASKLNAYTYLLRQQLKQVTNIQVKVTDDIYTLSFDLQDNAQNYSVEIIKLNDPDYVAYLASEEGLTLPITNVKGAIDITNYVKQAGEYYIYMTAHPGAGSSYYDSSDRSSEFEVVSKLKTLLTPYNLTNNNISNTEYTIGWAGDANADSYSIKVSTPAGKEFAYRTNQTSLNINDIITIEGNYSFSVKAVVSANSESSKTFVSSPFSESFNFTYRYAELKDFERHSVYLFSDSVKYNFAITNADASHLTNLLWYHLLHGVNENYGLTIYFEPVSEDNKLEQIALSLASNAGLNKIYDFTNDDDWKAIRKNTSATAIDLISLICNKLLHLYPEMAVISNYTCEKVYENNDNILRFKFKNELDVEKEINTTYVDMALDYTNKFNYIPSSLRRSTNGVFAIDKRKEMEVSTTEQLFMAVQYGFKPVFVGNATMAQKVYENAKLVLTAIVSSNMTDLEKTTAIFDWLEKSFNINMGAKLTTVGDVNVKADISVWGKRAEFYLEGILGNITQAQNGDIVVGSTQATSESFAKAFTLLCGIEGIETRKVNGNLGYKTNQSSQIEQHYHNWNKVYIETTDETGKAWYNVDLTYSDLRYNAFDNMNSYNMASHLFFLVSDEYLRNNLNFGSTTVPLSISEFSENVLPTMPADMQIKETKNYDYYSNTFVNVSFEELQQTINNSYLKPRLSSNGEPLQAEDAFASMGLKYDASADLRHYFNNEYKNVQSNSGVEITAPISHLQAYMLNMLVYGKSNLLSNENSVATIEMRLSSNYGLGSTLKEMLNSGNSNSMTQRSLNGMFRLNNEQYISVSTFVTQTADSCVIVATMKYAE